MLEGISGAGTGTVPTNASSQPSPSNGPVTVNQTRGCSYSEIEIGQSGSDAVNASSASIPNDVNSSTSSLTTSSNPLVVYYTASSGSFDVTTGGATLSDYIRIKTNRVLPEITAAQVTPSAVSDTSSFAAVSTIGVCPNSTVSFGTNSAIAVSPTTTEYEWTIIDLDNGNATSAPSGGSNGATTSHTFTNAGGNYQVRLRVNSACCGWSVPIYMDVDVSSATSDTATIASSTGSFSACEGDTVSYSAVGLSGVSQYVWTVPSGSSINGGLKYGYNYKQCDYCCPWIK